MLFKNSKVEAKELFPGYFGKFVHGDELTVAIWDVKKGHDIPVHQHINEQIVNCLDGEFIVRIDGEEYLLHAGDSVVIPANAEHSAVAITDVKCLDVFTPVREDYKF